MAKIEFKPNKLYFDTAGAIKAIQKLVEDRLGEVADTMVVIIRKEIMNNGNGSTFMRQTAANAVEKELTKSTSTEVEYEIGFNDAVMGVDELFVRIMVVMHGNQAHGRLWTKPGSLTYKKHVTGPSESSAQSTHPLPEGFNWTEDITQHVIDNADKEIKHLFDACINQINQEINGSLLAPFFHVG